MSAEQAQIASYLDTKYALSTADDPSPVAQDDAITLSSVERVRI